MGLAVSQQINFYILKLTSTRSSFWVVASMFNTSPDPMDIASSACNNVYNLHSQTLHSQITLTDTWYTQTSSSYHITHFQGEAKKINHLKTSIYLWVLHLYLFWGRPSKQNKIQRHFILIILSHTHGHHHMFITHFQPFREG